MDRSFYRFALSLRGGAKEDPAAAFAEHMFNDMSFPKDETAFDPCHATSKKRRILICHQ